MAILLTTCSTPDSRQTQLVVKVVMHFSAKVPASTFRGLERPKPELEQSEGWTCIHQISPDESQCCSWVCVCI